MTFSQDYKWEWAIEPQFDFASYFSEGLAAVRKGDFKSGKWGYIDKKGTLVINYQYDDAFSFSNDRAYVVNKSLKDKYHYIGKTGYINKSGILCIDYKYNHSYNSNFSDGLAAVDLNEGRINGSGYIDVSGKTILNFVYYRAGEFSEGLAPVIFPSDNQLNIPSDKVQYINEKGDIKIRTNYDFGNKFSEGVAVVCVNVLKNDKYMYTLYGAIDKWGNEIFKPKYKYISEFKEGYARIASNRIGKGHMGFIDKKGKIVIDTIYDWVNDFSNGLAAVKLNEVRGFIDKSGEMVIPITLNSVGSLSEGLARAEQNGKHGYIRLLNEYEQVFRYVNLELNKWEQKGKYENLSTYQARVNENTRKTKIKDLQEEAMNTVGGELFEKNKPIATFDYDTESELFKIDFESIPDIYVKVPLSEALVFDENFSSVTYNDITWGMNEEELVITKASLFNPTNSKTYTYDINTPVTFKKIAVAANFNPIDLDDIAIVSGASQQESSEVIEVGKSDVDVDIPKTTTVKNKTYCLIIGNEDYTKYQPSLNNESNVDFARNDATIFSEYCNKTLGIPKENITVLNDAISSQMKREIARLTNKAKYSEGDTELIFYYSGHGFPDNDTKEGYIMPVDIAGANVTDGIKLSQMYKDLAQYPAKKVTVILDACFSGGGRNQGLLAAKSVRVNPKEDMVEGNLVVFAASSNDQESLFYKEKQHGLFTYYFLKKLKESQGDVTYEGMYDYLKVKVPSTASDKHYKEQNPNMSVSSDVGGEWMGWKFK